MPGEAVCSIIRKIKIPAAFLKQQSFLLCGLHFYFTELFHSNLLASLNTLCLFICCALTPCGFFYGVLSAKSPVDSHFEMLAPSFYF